MKLITLTKMTKDSQGELFTALWINPDHILTVEHDRSGDFNLGGSGERTSKVTTPCGVFQVEENPREIIDLINEVN